MDNREKWLAILAEQGIGAPESLHLINGDGYAVQATSGEPPGTIKLGPLPPHLLLANMSHSQRLRQVRCGRTFDGEYLRGEMILMPRETPSTWVTQNPCNRLDVTICPFILGDDKPFEVVNRFQFRDPEMEAICRQLYAEVGRNGAPTRTGQGGNLQSTSNVAAASAASDLIEDKLYIESMVMQLAVILLRRHSDAAESAKRAPIGGLTRSQLRRVVDYIEANLHRELTLGDLARITDLSLHHFARMFKQSMGAAPHRYVLERRVDRAKEMLRHTQSSLVDISLTLGFCSQSHFTNTFRRMVGATPGEFRLQS